MPPFSERENGTGSNGNATGTLLRPLQSNDLPALLALSAAANWNQTSADWQRILDLSAPLALGIEIDGAIRSTATAVSYAKSLAWVGMVLTLPEYRNQGLARRLLARLLEQLDLAGIPLVGLDATTMGTPLYESLGFAPLYPVERWLGFGSPIRPIELPPFTRISSDSFGANRSRLLSQLAADGHSAQLPDGSFALLRPGSSYWQLGPIVASSAHSARHLIEWGLSHVGPQNVIWDLLADHEPALELAREFGFSRQRQLLRMLRGPAGLWQNSLASQFALAGFEYG